MFCWHILIERLFDLHKLCRGNISGVNRIHNMYGVPQRIILCHHGSNGSDGFLCCGLVLSRLFDSLLNLSFGKVFVVGVYVKLHKLFRGNISGLNRINFMYFMH